MSERKQQDHSFDFINNSKRATSIKYVSSPLFVNEELMNSPSGNIGRKLKDEDVRVLWNDWNSALEIMAGDSGVVLARSPNFFTDTYVCGNCCLYHEHYEHFPNESRLDTLTIFHNNSRDEIENLAINSGLIKQV